MRRLPIFRIDQELKLSGGSSPACSTPSCCFLKYQDITTPDNCINYPLDIFMELLRTFLFFAFDYSSIGTYPYTGAALNTGLRVNPVIPVKFFYYSVGQISQQVPQIIQFSVILYFITASFSQVRLKHIPL